MQVSFEDGTILVRHARIFVSEFLSGSESSTDEFTKRFSFPAGVFVTLTKADSLRGCIGYPLPHTVLATALKESAIAAATGDPRFPAIDREELDRIVFEVTILSEPQTIQVNDPQEYLTKIKVGRDGLIVKKGLESGLLLPQVPVQYNWNEAEFLEHTCEKAGLGKNCWKDKNTQIQKFEGTVFAETTPNGAVRQEL